MQLFTNIIVIIFGLCWAKLGFAGLTGCGCHVRFIDLKSGNKFIGRNAVDVLIGAVVAEITATKSARAVEVVAVAGAEGEDRHETVEKSRQC